MRRNNDSFYRSERVLVDLQIDRDHQSFDRFGATVTVERGQRALAIKRVPPPVLTNLQRKNIQFDELIAFNAFVKQQMKSNATRK